MLSAGEEDGGGGGPPSAKSPPRTPRFGVDGTHMATDSTLYANPLVQALQEGRYEDNSGRVLSTPDLMDGSRVIGLYCSASWCGPCKEFTPKLAEYYRAYQRKFPRTMDIVFLSLDRTAADWSTYRAGMPWLAWTAVDSQYIMDLVHVSSIPQLVFVNPGTGEILCPDGRKVVLGDPAASHPLFPRMGPTTRSALDSV